jgi:hypothetical protein
MPSRPVRLPFYLPGQDEESHHQDFVGLSSPVTILSSPVAVLPSAAILPASRTQFLTFAEVLTFALTTY